MAPPFALNGIISKKGESDWFKFKASKSQPLDVTVYARKLRSPIDTVIDKLEPQVVRAKTKPRRVRERAAPETAAVLAREGQGTVGPTDGTRRSPQVTRIKRFDMEPMFEEDAITRMEELGHAFFLFLNAEDESLCVLYRRRDGGYGMIEPVTVSPGRSR